MEIETIYYFYVLSTILNITKTAKKLYMSQQTLSNHIMRLEEHYNSKFFYRKPKLKLTPSGEIFLKFAEKILNLDNNIKRKLVDYETEVKGIITIGASSPRSNTYLPEILLKFSKKYSQVSINLIDEYSNKLEEMVFKNELDFAICVEQKTNLPNIIVEKLLDDKIYFLVSDVLLKKYYTNIEELKLKSINGVDLKDFKELPFLTISSNNRMSKVIDNCFQEAEFIPKSYLNTKYTSMLVPLCNSGLVSGFTSQMNLNAWINEFEKHVNIFPLYQKNKQVKLTIDLIRNKDRYLPKYSFLFIDLLREYFKKLQYKKLKRIAE